MTKLLSDSAKALVQVSLIDPDPEIFPNVTKLNFSISILLHALHEVCSEAMDNIIESKINFS